MGIRHILLAGMAAAMMPAPGLAHGSASPSHGGIMVVSGETQIETVRTPTGLDIYVSEEGLPLQAAGLAGHAIIKDGAGAPVALLPIEANRLQAPGVVPGPGQAVVVMIEQKANGLRSFATYQF